MIDFNLVEKYINWIDKIKSTYNIANVLDEILTEVRKINNSINNNGYEKTNEYVEKIMPKYKTRLNGIINIVDQCAVSQRTVFTPNAITKQENCDNFLTALIKLALKEIVKNLIHKKIVINYGDELGVVFALVSNAVEKDNEE